MPRPLTWLLVAVLAIAVAAGGIAAWYTYHREPLPTTERCTATLGSSVASIDLEQAENAGLIAGMSIKRGLAPRAASIALATAYQESKIRNLDYGHADSIGLFQQRPSKGWGSVEEIMDPWYSTGKFYTEMVKVKDWENKDINDVAQAVQRSAYPEAYRQHEENARALASTLTGETPAGFTCAFTHTEKAHPKLTTTFLTKTYGKKVITITQLENGLEITAKDSRIAWSVAQVAVSNAKRYGIDLIQVEGMQWKPSPWTLAEWEPDEDAPAKKVIITFLG
jgi:hypothetical protein